MTADIRDQAADAGLSNDETQELIEQVSAIADPAEVDRRLLTLASYGRPTARQRVEHRLLAERQVGLAALGAYQAAGADSPVFDAVRGPGNGPVPARPGSADPGLRAIDRHLRSGVLNSVTADRLDGLVRREAGPFATYVGAVGDDAYTSAFAKMVRDPLQGHLRFSREEAAAVSAASSAGRIKDAAIDTTSTGFPAPLTVDPSMILENAGALNPLRRICRVLTVGTKTWQGVNTQGVTASYAAEGTPVSDDTPTLGGPKITAERGQAFVQFSIEASQDDTSLLGELSRLIADARDVLDAQKFVAGTGTDEPYGLLGGDATYSLGASQQVSTAGAATTAYGDFWALKAAIPARFIARTTFVATPQVLDAAYQMVGSGSTEPPLFAGYDRSGDFMGRPQAELSTLDTGLSTSGQNIMIAGDFHTAYVIIDRIGMNVELVPHILDQATARPVGRRGLYALWRTGAAVVAANALRYLTVQ